MENLNQTERDVLKGIISSLKESTESNLYPGDLNQWVQYANKMKFTINALIPVLEIMSEKDKK